MFCTNCGAQLPDGSKFCTACGAPLSGGAAGGDSEKTRVVPTAAAARASETASWGPLPPAAPPQQPWVAPKRSGRGLVAAAVITSVLALAAVVALVVVVIDPFGLHLLDGPAPAAEQLQADTTATDEQGTAEPDAPAEPAEPAAPAEPEPAPEPDSEPTTDAGAYVLPDSATRLYSADELSGLSDWELYIARNEIYARHGREFQNQDLRDYFGQQPWYTPRYTPEEFDSLGLLNDTERQNASTILSVEQARGSQYL